MKHKKKMDWDKLILIITVVNSILGIINSILTTILFVITVSRL